MKTTRMHSKNWGFPKLLVVAIVTLIVVTSCGAFASPSIRPHSRYRRAVHTFSVMEDVGSDDVLFDLGDQNEAKPLASYIFEVVNSTGVSSNIFRIDDFKLKLKSNAPTAQLAMFDREAHPTIQVNIEATKQESPNTGRKF